MFINVYAFTTHRHPTSSLSDPYLFLNLLQAFFHHLYHALLLPPPQVPLLNPLPQNSTAIEFIPETLYASLADVLERQPSLRQLLKRDPPRAHFASVAFAILNVFINSMNTDDDSVIVILGKRLTVSDCPVELRSFMIKLSVIGQQATSMD